MSRWKHHVDVRLRFSAGGDMIPIAILWPDGREFEIDSILDIGVASCESGGAGLRYIVMIMGQTRYLFYANNYDNKGRLSWFVESQRELKR